MNTLVRIPNLEELVENILGTPYAAYDCRALVAHLFMEGFHLDLTNDRDAVAREFEEVWFRSDPRNPIALAQPWDLWICAQHPAWPIGDHVGLVVNETSLVHARPQSTGAVVEPMRRYRPWLLQLARLRRLL